MWKIMVAGMVACFALCHASAQAQDSSEPKSQVTIRSAWLRIYSGDVMVVHAMIFNAAKLWTHSATVQCDFWVGSQQQHSIRRTVDQKPIPPGFGLQFSINFGIKFFPTPYAMDCAVMDATFGGPPR
jgi:hypothetical protein